MTRSDDIAAVILEKPDASARDVVSALGISRHAVRGAARRAGIQLAPEKTFHTSTSNKFFPRVRGTLEERFQAKVVIDPNSGCWLWAGESNGKYGSIGIRATPGGKSVKHYAHRVAYELYIGPIPDKLEIDHKCRTPMCVNPDHLEAVTHSENLRRIPKALLTTVKTECPQGHKYTGEHWKRPRGRNPYRYCPKCETAAKKRFEAKDPRPARRNIPIAIKRTVSEQQDGICPCGCKTPIWTGKKCNIQWDHSPALRLRDVNADRTDYIPVQHDPRYIVGRCVASHKAKTHGTGATTAGTDIGKIKKERARTRPQKPKRAWGSRPMGKSRGFPPAGSRPMRRR